MLPGFGGHLISESFLEEYLVAHSRAISLFDRRRLFEWRRGCAGLGPASNLRTIVETAALPFSKALGYASIEDVDLASPVASATLCTFQPVATLLVTNWGEHLDPLWRQAIVESGRRTTSWCVLFNGTTVRLLETRRVYSRRYAEFDLDLALDDERTIVALWTLLTASELCGSGNGRLSSIHQLLAQSDRHANGVSRSLKDGVLTASGEILNALLTRAIRPPLDDTFEQALTLVYRLLFLLFAEARGLMPIWHPIYRESYSVEAMRDQAEGGRTSAGLWDAVRAVSRLVHAGCRTGTFRVTAFNGRLFAPARTPLADRRDLDDDAARRAILALTTRAAADHGGRELIAYRDLGVDQIGAVYETLLDYEPISGRHGAALEAGSNRRKASGTFYTPHVMAQFLVRRTLAPLVIGRSPEEILDLKVLDPSMGSGAFLVASCRYLAEAYETALVRAGACHPSDIGRPERIAIRRTIAERCLFGVDVNPMAVQLARLSLWLATLAGDKPLSFLDHHLVAGDSVLGTWLSALHTAPSRRSRAPRRDLKAMALFEGAAVTDIVREALPVRFSLASLPNDTAADVRNKERALAALNDRKSAISRWKRVADVWCARWFSSDPVISRFNVLSDAILTGRSTLPAKTAAGALAAVERIAATHRLFHWELEFPEVFFDASGQRSHAPGFDAIIGNPPWDMIRADLGPRDARSKARIDLHGRLRFARDSGVYTCHSSGHANLYQLFVERAVALTRTGGRIGLVVPSGLATDHGSASLRRHLFSQCAIDALVGFENRQAVFPIHRSVRFLLVTATRGTPTADISCRLGEVDPAALERAGDEASGHESWFPVRLNPAFLQHVSGDDLSIPDLRSPLDVTIVEQIATLFPPLGDARGWNQRFGRELNATEDRQHFVTTGKGLPIVEGKFLEPFHVDFNRVGNWIAPRDARRLIGTHHERPRLGYRDVASATNRLTLIAAVLPGGCVSTHTVFCSKQPLDKRALFYLCGLFNSFVLNYLVRLRVTTHVTTAIVERLPVPPRDHAPAALEEIAALAKLLTRARIPHARARLNARVAALYQLTGEQFEHILKTFPLVPAEERAEALALFKRIRT